ncbi:MAG: caspase family protein [Ferrovibrio sp.]|uniref:caspase family protein n=1 Tax=Ferrovibrio sp. TaxID=1917215 RepID=UPI00260D2A05|nr:caspase family protein [Ferrovibrio sp.]MCW0234515.1 caspase family protein [Ferrovibrio sp.]
MLRLFALTLLLVFGGLSPTTALAERRVALVIGNSAYHEAPLRNPVNDARAMATTLRELNFDVTLLENADRTAMQRAALEFGRKLSEDVAGLFYFSGHGMQVRGANYLVPIRASVTSEEEVEVEAMDVNYILARMAIAKNRFNIVILDACRNNPFERSFRSAAGGLAAISAPRGTLIAYATAPGSVAADGQGTNGLYTGELISALKAPNLTIEQTFKQARAEVVTKSSGKQTPWESSSVIGDFVFRPQAAAPVVGTADATFWTAVKDSSNPSDYQAYLKAYPQGFYAALAQSRISILTAVRDAEISRVARDAADKAAREALLQAQQREAETARANQPAQAQTQAQAPVQMASLSSPSQPSTAKPASALDMKANWPAIEQAVRAHFADPENAWFYNSHIRAPAANSLTLNGVNYYDPVTVTAAGIEAVFVLQGSFPFARNIYTGGFQPFTANVKYILQQQGSGYVIREFLPVSAQAMRPKETPDQSRVTP